MNPQQSQTIPKDTQKNHSATPSQLNQIPKATLMFKSKKLIILIIRRRINLIMKSLNLRLRFITRSKKRKSMNKQSIPQY